MGPPPALSLIIPAYNEEVRLAASLDAVAQFAASFEGGVEIIIVDDGSSDRTAAIACEFAGCRPEARVLINERNRGKGYSIRRGVLDAQAETILVSDADLSTPLSEAGRLMERLRAIGEGIVIGSRGLRESNVEIRQNPIRETMGRTFNFFVRALTKLPYKDTQCGFKLMSRSVIYPIFKKARIDGFAYDVEILYVAHRRRIPIQEVPVTWRNAAGSKVGIVSAPLAMLRDIARVILWHRQGRYDAP